MDSGATTPSVKLIRFLPLKFHPEVHELRYLFHVSGLFSMSAKLMTLFIARASHFIYVAYFLAFLTDIEVL